MPTGIYFFIFNTIKREKIILGVSVWIGWEVSIHTCQRNIQNSIKHLIWSFLQKWLTAFRCLTGLWMYFPKILRTPFYKHLCFLTPLDGFSCNVISNNVKARWSVKCWLQKFCNILCSTFKYLYLSLIFYKFR